MNEQELQARIKLKYHLSKVKSAWCFMFGHDKIFPHPNKHFWACARCQMGPDDRWPEYVYPKQRNKK